ncbi:MAG TPA: metallophosphoesterase [Pyrinomonadaceae bacterium]|nr:metallophosphoesterase [Pyrinomonadaceae bacterium]
MSAYHRSLSSKLFAVLIVAFAWSAGHAQSAPLEIRAKIRGHFRFVVYGDTRFTDPADRQAANAEFRQQLVAAIAAAHPKFVVFSGDIAYNGDKAADWNVYDRETAVWRERKIPVFPTLGNHDLHGDLNVALANYFARFPDLKQNRYYAVQAGSSLLLFLDSSLDELNGPQGDWLRERLEHLPKSTDFVFVVLHHPPYTSSSDAKTYGGGHSARPAEQKLAAYLEAVQPKLRAHIVVFSGHVHNYERHLHGGVTYFVTGGGGAHAYPITRAPDDPFQSLDVIYHYLLVEIRDHQLRVTINRVEMKDGVASWTKPDLLAISTPASAHHGNILSRLFH